MAEPIKSEITKLLGVNYQSINSALVSAQNRQRVYWHNIPDVPQPEDKKILLKDILDSAVAWQEKSYCITATEYKGSNPEQTLKKHRRTMVAEPINFDTHKDSNIVRVINKTIGINSKGRTLTASSYKGAGSDGMTVIAEPVNVGDIETVQKAIPKIVNKKGYLPEMFNAYNCSELTDKSPTLSTGSMVTSSCATLRFEKTNKPIYEVKNGQITVKDKQYPIKLPDGYYIIRKLTPIECERLQTLPNNYTAGISNTQRYKCLGNGWTAEVIIHILKHMNIPLDEEIAVLSMYDGIATGRYCLDKLGYKNVRYYSYEVDKYAMKVANSNYPDIIQCGDAFQVRENNWNGNVFYGEK